MPVASMTGFARADAVADERSLVWEVRSVNGKGLDMRLRLPPGLDRLEPAMRQEIQKRFARGNIQATLTVERSAEAAAPAVNRALLIQLAGVARDL
ncbi:MAG: YicC/YloC family endoribonuclease, partial [Rhizobiaceae bacterium]